jgi:hypothetical protein
MTLNVEDFKPGGKMGKNFGENSKPIGGLAI